MVGVTILMLLGWLLVGGLIEKHNGGSDLSFLDILRLLECCGLGG
jgi:hypothetical protein